MKVTRYGWEFPLKISGGIDTALYDLTEGLLKLIDLKGPFVVFKIFWGEIKSNIKLIGTIEGYVTNYLNEFSQSAEFIQVCSKQVLYVDEVEYRLQTACKC